MLSMVHKWDVYTLTPPQGPGTLADDGYKILSEPEVRGDCSEIVSSGHDRTSELMNHSS